MYIDRNIKQMLTDWLGNETDRLVNQVKQTERMKLLTDYLASSIIRLNDDTDFTIFNVLDELVRFNGNDDKTDKVYSNSLTDLIRRLINNLNYVWKKD